MFNLVVGFTETVWADRMLENVPVELSAAVGDKRNPSTGLLTEIPALQMPEIGADVADRVARVGTITSITGPTPAGWRYRFEPDPGVPAIPLDELHAARERLGLGEWDFNRTRWTVRPGNLYSALAGARLIAPPVPAGFGAIPQTIDPQLVAVMMPFAPAFDAVWDAIRGSVLAKGRRCLRADNIWEHDVLIDDVLGLIMRASVVVCDLSGQNANVFYETGLAHGMSRPTVLITQSNDDVPFDLRHRRHLRYDLGPAGLEKLAYDLSGRLETLMP